MGMYINAMNIVTEVFKRKAIIAYKKRWKPYISNLYALFTSQNVNYIAHATIKLLYTQTFSLGIEYVVCSGRH
jgi:hypothetical protein